MEFEVVSLIFPLQDNSMVLQAASMANSSSKITPMTANSASAATAFPSGFKFKKILKETSRLAITTNGIRSRTRRSYLLSELTSLNHLLSTVPGIVAPRYPQVVAIASLIRAEIINYFRVYDLLTAKSIRKDTRKFYVAEDYEDHDIILLLAEIRKLIQHVETHVEVIRSYYMEYLVTIDMKKLNAQIAQHASISDIYKVQFDEILSDIQALQAIYQSSANVSEKITPSLKKLRMNWDMITYILYSRNIVLASRNLDSMRELGTRMTGIYDRSRFVDEIDSIIGHVMEPHDIFWFRERLVDTFSGALNSSSRQGNEISAVFTFLPGLRYSFHSNNPVDAERIKLSVEFFMDDRMNDLGIHIVALIKIYWAHLQALENQVTQIEAARRIEKIILQKHSNRNRDNDSTGGSQVGGSEHGDGPSNSRQYNSTVEAQPGSESEAWAKQSIEKLIDIHHRIVQVMSMVHQVGTFRIFRREYSIETFLRQRIVAFVEEQLINLFTQAVNDTTGLGALPTIYNMLAPKVLFCKLRTLCHATQLAFSFIDTHISTSMRSILFKECCDLSIPPPGYFASDTEATRSLADVMPTSTTAEYYGNLLWKVMDWFSKLCHQILSSDVLQSSSSDPPLIWAPFTRSFLRPTKLSMQHPSAASSKTRGSITNALFNSSTVNSAIGVSLDGLGLESYLSRQELSSLCHIIGVQGVRVLDQDLLSSIIERVGVIKEILFKHQQDLLDLYHDVTRIFEIARKLHEPVANAAGALKEIGILLSIRDLLHEALADSLQQYSPSLVSLTKTAAEMVHPFGNRKAAATIHSLAFDAGHLPNSSIDLALAQALSAHLFRGSDRACLSLLPVLGSILFVDESWRRAQYLSQYDCFADNEHLVCYALSKLFQCAFGKESIVELDSSLLISSSMQRLQRGGAGEVVTPTKKASTKATASETVMLHPANLISAFNTRPLASDRAAIAAYDIRIHSLVYLTMSMQVIYLMKSSAYHVKAYPVNHIVTAVEHFMRWMPLLTWSDFHALIPNQLLHVTRTDAANTVPEARRAAVRANSILSQASSLN
jgi:hypothetical protein